MKAVLSAGAAPGRQIFCVIRIWQVVFACPTRFPRVQHLLHHMEWQSCALVMFGNALTFFYAQLKPGQWGQCANLLP